MKKILLVLFLASIFAFAFGQKRKEGLNFIENTIPITGVDTITYFGWDFSRVIMTNKEMLGQSDEFRLLLRDLNRDLNRRYNTKVVRKMTKKRIIMNAKPTLTNFNNRNFENSIVTTPFIIPLDTVQKIIENYDVGNSKGIGFVTIAENMNKPKRYTSCVGGCSSKV